MLEGGGERSRSLAHCLRHAGICSPAALISGSCTPGLWDAAMPAAPAPRHKDPTARPRRPLTRFQTLARDRSTAPPLCKEPGSHHKPIAPAVFCVSETVNHTPCYFFFPPSPGFITVLPSFPDSATNACDLIDETQRELSLLFGDRSYTLAYRNTCWLTAVLRRAKFEHIYFSVAVWNSDCARRAGIHREKHKDKNQGD